MLANNPSRFETRALACLVFGVVGDAIGTPTENLEPGDIEQRFGWVESFEGDGTYDTILRDMIASALIRTSGYADADHWATLVPVNRLTCLFKPAPGTSRSLSAGSWDGRTGCGTPGDHATDQASPKFVPAAERRWRSFVAPPKTYLRLCLVPMHRRQPLPHHGRTLVAS
jgi:hypothetical protein